MAAGFLSLGWLCQGLGRPGLCEGVPHRALPLWFTGRHGAQHRGGARPSSPSAAPQGGVRGRGSPQQCAGASLASLTAAVLIGLHETARHWPLGDMQHMVFRADISAAWVKQDKEMSRCMVSGNLQCASAYSNPVWRNLTTALPVPPHLFFLILT